MITKEKIGIIPSGVANARGDSATLQARRGEMADAKELTAQPPNSSRARGCRPGPCLQPQCSQPPPCLAPPKCGPGPCKNKL